MDMAGLGCLVGYMALAWLARAPGEPPLTAFFVVVAWTALLTFALYFHCAGMGGGDEGAGRFPILRMVLWAALFRLCGLVGGPLFEDDFFRYLWDGYRFAVDGSPYGRAPEEFFADSSVPERFRRVLDRINHPDLPTIYGPVTQLLFLLAYAVRPASVLPIQTLLVLTDLATIVLLLRLAPPRAVLLYAWCPLVVKEVAFTAHPDALGVCLLVAAIVLARRGRAGAAAVLLALAACTKVFALLLAPFVLAGMRWRAWVLFAAVVALVRLPFLIWGGGEAGTLAVFALEWKFNAALFDVLAFALPDLHARVLAGVAFVAFWWWCLARHRRSPETVARGDWIIGALLLLGPVINPWYLLWLLPFAVVHRSAWAWTASVAVLLSYVNGLNLGDFDLGPYETPAWVRPLEFGAIALACLWDIWQRRALRGQTTWNPRRIKRVATIRRRAASEQRTATGKLESKSAKAASSQSAGTASKSKRRGGGCNRGGA